MGKTETDKVMILDSIGVRQPKQETAEKAAPKPDKKEGVPKEKK